MQATYNEPVDSLGLPVPISIPCRITEQRDEPILIGGCVPYFGHYTQAYDFLRTQGYSLDADGETERGIVIDCYGLQAARQQFGDRLVSYSDIV